MNGTPICPFCSSQETETVDHVVTRCPLYDEERQAMLINLQLGLSWTPTGLIVYHSIAELDQHSLTLVLLGQHDPKWALDVSVLIHRVSRQYFLMCWEKRTRMKGFQPGLTLDGTLRIAPLPAGTDTAAPAGASYSADVKSPLLQSSDLAKSAHVSPTSIPLSSLTSSV